MRLNSWRKVWGEVKLNPRPDEEYVKLLEEGSGGARGEKNCERECVAMLRCLCKEQERNKYAHRERRWWNEEDVSAASRGVVKRAEDNQAVRLNK